MTNSNRYFTARVACDSLGHEVIPSNAISVGTLDPVAECEARKRALDERERELNERECALDEREQELEARADAITAHEARNRLLADATRKMKALNQRMDSFEEQVAEEQALNEEPITLPPGVAADPDDPPTITDAGELQSTKPPLQRYPERDEPELEPPPELADSDGDPGAVLPQAPIPPANRYYDPHPEPVSTLDLPTTVED
jgi:hypothetical protein